ncbi:MAG: PQQ-dependent sugar dehydrogenase [Aigarchaeota archaeon]|nr:PQQ-dependent sugar dehydrogenase [Aigarchaeota archaeon]MDW8092493.1 PQQ-dependent sugar dehydrogenase [Nitrososphaerota archaeon]
MSGLSRRKLLLLSISIISGYLAYVILRENVPSGGRGPDIMTIDEIIGNLDTPWSISFISDDEAIVTERFGRVSVLDTSTGRLDVLGEVQANEIGEGGLLGSAVRRTRGGIEIFLYYTYRRGGSILNRVSKFDTKLRDETILLDEIPGAGIHNGGRLKIGPDDRLYVTTGDAGRPELAQSVSSLAGKILRLNPDGSVPNDNPFRGSPVYSLGHRNPQGIDWHPVTKRLYSTEHGPTGERLQFAHDEINLITPGGNYGWPEVIGRGNVRDYIDPIWESGSETWAPSGCTFYSGSQNPEWRNNFIFAALRGAHLQRLVLSGDGVTVVQSERLLRGDFGRLRDVVEGPDGSLYVLTSNRDGRGSPRSNDDKVLRISWRG